MISVHATPTNRHARVCAHTRKATKNGYRNGYKNGYKNGYRLAFVLTYYWGLARGVGWP